MNWLKIVYMLVSLAGLVVFYYLMILQKGSPQRLLGKDFTMPDVRFHYSPDELYQTFESAGEEGRPLMKLYWQYDFGLMACLTGVMLAVMANVMSVRTWVYPMMLSLAFARTAVDAAEDLAFLYLLRRFPEHREAMAGFASVVTTVKHLLLIAWIVCLFFILLLAAFNI